MDRVFSQDITDVQEIVSLLLGAAGIGGGGQEWPDGLGIDPRRRDRHQRQLGIPQRGQLAAEDAAGVDVDGAIEPLGLRHRRVTIHDERLPSVLGGPVVAHREAIGIGLPGGLAVEGKLPHPRRGTPLQTRFHAGMGDDELPVVEHVVADQAIEEVGHLTTETCP